ncbi:MAG: response regulator transcription factor [Bdellovibrionales bacterium]|nr:response regulator transcription factor [Bdellovibrionales bacterium]
MNEIVNTAAPNTQRSSNLPKLLVIDDEPQIRVLLKEFLTDHFQVTLGSTGREAVELAKKIRPDLILMDIMMPKLDGVAACDQLRQMPETKHIPVLMLTAANTSFERIRAFNSGADDFISKPFEIEELLTRLRSKLKRARELGKVSEMVLILGNLTLNVQSREVNVDGRAIDLSPSEFGILQLLMARAGTVVSRKDIMDVVWGDQNKNDRLIDAHVTSLRKKVSAFDGNFQTVYGAGYRISKKS